AIARTCRNDAAGERFIAPPGTAKPKVAGKRRRRADKAPKKTEKKPESKDQQDQRGCRGEERRLDLAIHPADDNGARAVGNPGEKRRNGGEGEKAEDQPDHDFPVGPASALSTAAETSSTAASAVARALALSRHCATEDGSAAWFWSSSDSAETRLPALASAAALAQTAFQSASPIVLTVTIEARNRSI